MSKAQAKWLLIYVFVIYLVVVMVPPIAICEGLRFWALGENYSFWESRVSMTQSWLLFLLNGALILVWAPHAKKIVNQHLLGSIRERAREALRVIDKD